MLVTVKRATVTSKILTRDFTSKNVSHRKTRKRARVTSKI